MHNNHFFNGIALLLIILSIETSFSQSTFHVATNGNDTNPGSETLPWKTFQKAMNTAIPNSTVFIKAGVYNEKVSVNVSGSPSGFITFRNYGVDTVVIDGTGQTGDQIILIQNVNYIRIIGLELRNNLNQTFGTGIWIQGHGNHIEVRNNRIHDMKAVIGGGDAMGISVYGSHPSLPLSNIIIDNNHLYNNQPGHSETLTLNGNVDTFQVTNNLVHDNDNIGIDMIGGEGTCPTAALDAARNGICSGNIAYNCRSNYGGGYAAGIYIDGGRNIIVERNISRQNDIGLEIGCENHGKTASNIIVRDNLIYDNDKGGIGFGGYNYPTTGQVTNSQFFNNTCFNNDVLNTGQGELSITYALNCTVKNNIFSSSSQNVLMTTTVGNLANNIIDYNLWCTPGGINIATIDYNGTVYFTFGGYTSGTGQDLHSLFANPQFVSTSLPSPNLRLQSTSPARDAGDTAFVTGNEETDFDGTARLINGRVDIGAFEYIVSVAGAPSPPNNLVAVAGNGQVALRWSKNPEVDVVKYRIYGDISPHPATIVGLTESILDTSTVITGLENETPYYVRITAVDIDENESGFSTEISSTPTSFTQLPEIPMLASSSSDSTAYTLQWYPAFGAVRYHLQLSTDGSFSAIDGEDSAVTDTLFTISSLSPSTAYYWRVRGENSLGVSEWSAIWSFFTYIGTASYSAYDRWNLISIPLLADTQLTQTLFPTASTDAYTFLNNTYVEKETLSYGIGYWIKFNGNQTIRLSGLLLTSDTIAVTQGWNLIGSLSSPVAVSTITPVPGSIQISNFYEYRNGYSVADTLKPFHGYWVKVNQDASLILSK